MPKKPASKKAKPKKISKKASVKLRESIERHFRPEGQGLALCGKKMTKATPWTDNFDKGVLLVTCSECRGELLRQKARLAGLPPMNPLPKSDGDEPTEPGPCFLCKKGSLDPKENYCSGCRKLICSDCETGNAPWGGHEPEDHKRDPDIDDYDPDLDL